MKTTEEALLANVLPEVRDASAQVLGETPLVLETGFVDTGTRGSWPVGVGRACRCGSDA